MYKAINTFTMCSKTETDSLILRTNQWFPVGRRKAVQSRGRGIRGANYMHKICKKLGYTEGFPGGASGREPACQEMRVRSLSWEDPL